MEPQVLRAAPGCSVRVTEGPGHARELAVGARAAGYRGVVILGGDGTVNEAGSGLLENPLPLGIIPAGRGNDLCRGLGFPLSPRDCWDMIARGTASAIDVGTLNGQRFMNIAGAGLDAEVAATANRFPRQLGGLIPYIASLILNLATYRNSHICVQGDTFSWEGRAALIAIGIGSYYGGGFNILPGAVPDDGLLDVCVAGDLGKVGIMKMVPSVIRGSHVDHPLFHSWKARSVTIESERPLTIQADGEVAGNLPASFGIEPRALMVLGRKG